MGRAPRRPPPPGPSAGYGRSCAHCARSKAKCVIVAKQPACARCARLGLQCWQNAGARKMAPKDDAFPAVVQLEKKVEDLLSTIAKIGQLSQEVVDSHSVHAVAPREPSHQATAADVSEQTEDGPQDLDMSIEVQRAGLERFRLMLSMFPFMQLPDDSTPETLARERPFLWMCILYVTSTPAERQDAALDKIRRQAADAIIHRHERSMDVLLGLLTCLGWATMNMSPTKPPFFALFCSLASTIVHDLRLTREPDASQRPGLYLKMWSMRPAQTPKPRTKEEKRAVLAFWFCTSIATTFSGKTETTKWTLHFDDCILDLIMPRDPDQSLITLVGVQRIADDAQELLRRLSGQIYHLRSILDKKSKLRRQLEDFREDNREVIRLHAVIALQFHSTEAQVHSVGLLLDIGLSAHIRKDSARLCVEAIRSWYDVFFSIPSREVMALPTMVYVSMVHMQAILHALTTANDAAFDKPAFRDFANLLDLLDRTIGKFKEAEQYLVDDPHHEYASRAVYGLSKIKKLWEPSLIPHLGTGEAQLASDQVDFMFDPDDPLWMSELFGPWEFSNELAMDV